MISRMRKSIADTTSDERVAARLILAVVSATLCLLLLIAGASLGVSSATAFSQPSPSGSPGGSPGGGEPKINLLNPAAGYDPHLGMPPRQSGVADPPKISDRFDGADNAYHIVAWAQGVPEGAIAEAYWFRSGGASIEQTIGGMFLRPGTTDTFETTWDIPSSLTDGPITIRARLFQPTPTGFQEIAMDEVVADLQNRSDPHTGPGDSPQTTPQDETVEILYPESGDPLGFFKAKGAGWAAGIEGTTSSGTSELSAFYSKTAPGQEPEFVKCGDDPTYGRPESTISAPPFPAGPVDDTPIPFIMGCTLASSDVPSRVTAVAIVTEEGDKSDRSDVATGDAELSQDAADVHRVASTYLQDPSRMDVDIRTYGNESLPSQGRRTAGTGTGVCMPFLVVVTDHLGRRVQGANVDVHMEGPVDDVRFSFADTTYDIQSSPIKTADKGHTQETGENCDNSARIQQSEHNRPATDDVKHVESADPGTGAPGFGGIDSGEWGFLIESGTPGFSELTAFVDSPAVTSESQTPEADDDLLSEQEPFGSYTAQWLPGAIRLTIDPVGQTHQIGTCVRYIVRLRGGTAPVPRANVDVHARGPSENLDFCDPGDGTPSRAPDDGGHDSEDPGEATHAGDPPRLQHTEGETDAEGNFVVGLVSPDTGDTTITAWYDGDADQDDDLPDGDPTAVSTETWSNASAAPRVNFVNPTAYGPSQNPPNHPATANGTQISNKQDTDTAFHIVTRVDSLVPIAGVEVLIGATADGQFTNLGEATRIASTDTYELISSVNVTDGSYVLRARILGTNVTKDQNVTVNRTTGSSDPPASQQAETLEITSPANAGPALFSDRRGTIRGVASAGAEGIDLFYTRVGPGVTPASADWIECGFVDLSGTGSTPQEFSGTCTLAAGDQAAQVTGVAALTYDCAQAGCDAAVQVVSTPAGTARTRNPGQKDTGDAHRVFGLESIPTFSIEPAETAGAIDQCQKFTVSVEDQTGQGILNENVDLHLDGPSDGASFCAPSDGSDSSRSAPDQGGHAPDPADTTSALHPDGGVKVHHTEGGTGTDGRFVVGITSDAVGDSRLVGWLDRNGNDVQDPDELSDQSIMHWGGDGEGCDIEGTDGPETLTGTEASERICGFGGNDTIRGGGGNDVILGGAGRDSMRGGVGQDTIRGAGGRDNVFGGRGRDKLFGGAGGDSVKGHGANDSLRGNRGNDLLAGGRGRDGCRGGGGRDRLRGCEAGSVAKRGFATRLRPV